MAVVADFLIFIGYLMGGVAVFMAVSLFLMSFRRRWTNTVKDYKERRVFARGPLGIMEALLKVGLACLIIGALLRIVASYTWRLF